MGSIPVGMKLVFSVVLCILAFGARSFSALAVLTAVNLLYMACFRPKPAALWRKGKFFLRQTVVIAALYVLRFGPAQGLLPGIRVSWQLFLAFLPGMTFVGTTPQPRIVRFLARILPSRTAFVAATCLRFTPLLVEEVQSIYEGQVMRGARILPRDLINPLNWPEAIHCLAVPAIIRCLGLAGEIALAARARGFETNRRRTCWPGD